MNVVHFVLRIVIFRQTALKLASVWFREDGFASSVFFLFLRADGRMGNGYANGPTKISLLIWKCHRIPLHGSCKVTSETVKQPSYGKESHRISSSRLS